MCLRFALILLAALCAVARADVRGCACDPERPETMKARECSLCNEAEKRSAAPGEPPYFFLKDNNPRKPNRWLLLWRAHAAGPHAMQDLPRAVRTALWTAAIARARELWGDDWGVAYNGEVVRTQCHLHVHVGKLLKGVETSRFVVVRHPSQIPMKPGEGVWVHGAGKSMHVHTGEQTTETVLMR
ncbi:MAG: hypothetical protein FJW40_10035 [Acidobacteria bacterium]|nr:hypothetical protein [Acidobacteriota bacterium]